MSQTTPNRIIAGMQTLLTPPEAWIQHELAGERLPTGHVVPHVEASGEEANCWCLLGARMKIRDELGDALSNTERLQAGSCVKNAIRELFPNRIKGEIAFIPEFNDHRDTTHEDVLRVLARAQEIASQ